VYEGEQILVTVKVEGHDKGGVEVLLHAAPGVQSLGGAHVGVADSMPPGSTAPGTTVVGVQVDCWGRRPPGVLELVMWDRFRLFECRTFLVPPEVVCYPRPAQHRGAPALGRLASRSGDHPARAAGEGVEFIGVRQYAPGDRQRSINWAATTRRGRLQVNTFASERSQDVVVIVDASWDVGSLGSSSLDSSWRGALGVARTYLGARDRVGAVFFGKYLDWLPPGMGNRQFVRLMGAMLEVVPGFSSDQDIDRVPRAALPSGASVIAFSPLLDTRFVETLRDLRERRFSVVVVDVLNLVPWAGRARSDRIVQRLWRMERQALMFSLVELGIPVVAWDGVEPLALPLQRRARQVAWSRR
jgi:uncharacterized protein (DUF58 family)